MDGLVVYGGGSDDCMMVLGTKEGGASGLMGGTLWSLCTTVALLLIPAEVRFTRTVSTFGDLLSLADCPRKNLNMPMMPLPMQDKTATPPNTIPTMPPSAQRTVDHGETQSSKYYTQSMHIHTYMLPLPHATHTLWIRTILPLPRVMLALTVMHEQGSGRLSRNMCHTQETAQTQY